MLEKKRLSAAEIEAQAALELPERQMMATQNGLVNVDIGDVILQVPIGVAANVCNIDVNVLVNQPEDAAAPCDASVDQFPRAFR